MWKTYSLVMKNITLALDDETLEAGRAYAERHQTTLNALVRELLITRQDLYAR
jgi:uncharacterized protein (DUF4415 family)